MAREDSPQEELANAVTHGVGTLLGGAGLVLLVVRAAQLGDAWQVTSTAIFGSTLVLLYGASTLYHSLRTEPLRALMQRVDHAAIFLLIAGTYTPFVLVTLRGPWGWSLFGVVWGMAVVGVVLKFWYAGRFRVVSTVVYLVMGWLVVVALKPLLATLPSGGMAWLVAGGLAYSFGTIFYLWRSLRYHHAMWHGFVLVGSACHWVAVYWYVVGRA